MYSEPIILPLNADSRLYALQDEQGRIIGTGTREICEVLLSIITNDVFKFRSTQTAKSEMKQTIG
jgi:hypothetical protein